MGVTLDIITITCSGSEQVVRVQKGTPVAEVLKGVAVPFGPGTFEVGNGGRTFDATPGTDVPGGEYVWKRLPGAGACASDANNSRTKLTFWLMSGESELEQVEIDANCQQWQMLCLCKCCCGSACCLRRCCTPAFWLSEAGQVVLTQTGCRRRRPGRGGFAEPPVSSAAAGSGAPGQDHWPGVALHGTLLRLQRAHSSLHRAVFSQPGVHRRACNNSGRRQGLG